jgi:23S rRNA pseudouridine1911/1915/1917 synthase
MDQLNFIVDETFQGTRLDKYIAVQLGEEYSRVYVKELMNNDLVLVNDKKLKPSYQVNAGDKISFKLIPQEESILEGEDIPLNIIYEDDWLLIIDKPVGMIVHPGAGNKTGTIVQAVLFHVGKLPEADNPVRPGIVHRLDKDTSGILVVAKNDRALRSLGKQFQNRTIKKFYVAVVKGFVECDNGRIDLAVARHPLNRKRMVIDEEDGKNASTTYHVMKRYKKFTLLRLQLHTGRTHQIRVHLSHIGHPIMGDRTYGFLDKFPRQALHAEMIGFTHPGTGEYIEFHSPLPDDIIETIARVDNE